MVRFIKKYYPSILVAVIIMWLSLSDSGKVNPGRFLMFENSDKVGHFIAYSFFTCVLLFNSSNWKLSGEIKYLVVIAPFLLGITLEILQRLTTTTRQADFYDFLANITGISIAVLFVFVLRSVIRPREA